MRYICDRGHVFDRPAEWVEHHGFWYGLGETFTGCPICLEGYENYIKCTRCGEFFRESEGHVDLCDKCYEETEL